MSKPEEKRARIIADQLAREAADRAAGVSPTMPTRRSNWAASASKARGPGRPKAPRPPRPG
jgi:hypothetical protein